MTTGSNHFPTPIFQHEVPGFEAINEKLYGLVKRLQAEDPAGVRRSNYGGWHSSDKFDLRDRAEFADLKKIIMAEATVVTSGMGFEGLGMVLSQPWFVVSPAGGMNARHCHPRSFLSGAYYVKVPPGSSPLCFHDPRPVKLYATPSSPNFKITPYTTETLNCTIREGLLVLFPAWLDHSVPPHQAEGERVVLSFNFAAM
ncbi:MAG TPA: TIGR02466 family protein [Polyangiaceae bacterium]|nr:TIGR02466 family protein [Polyangiaceae bacterium]